MRIYGAGIAGLLAGSINQTAQIYEASSRGERVHKALLRFRTPNVGHSVGVEFRRVRVRKGVWMDGDQAPLTIRTANLYSKKVLGRVRDRSIWNLDSCDRYIAPEDFIEILADRCSNRVHWNSPVSPEDFFKRREEPVISTIPLSTVVGMAARAGLPDVLGQSPEFKYKSINVRRWRVPGADVFQTIYFPSPDTTLYRASITGDLLIAEYTTGRAPQIDDGLFEAFGLHETDCLPLDRDSQRFGKIAEIDETWRKRAIYRLSLQFNLYSLGRFGTWRNILLDDVLDDINVIKRLSGTNNQYDHALVNAS